MKKSKELNKTYIYESPDKGKTIFRREFGVYGKREQKHILHGGGYSVGAEHHFIPYMPNGTVRWLPEETWYTKAK